MANINNNKYNDDTDNYYNPMRCPFDIQSENTIESNKNIFKINYEKKVKGYVVNTDHNIHFDLDEESQQKSYIIFYDKITKSANKYYLLHIHIHNPSEYTIDGIYKPMEIHFYHEYIDEKDFAHVFVIGFLINLGQEDISFIPKILYSVPDNESINEKKIKIDLSELNSINKNPYYNFIGSLTSPNFTPYFQWVVFNGDDIKNINMTITDETYRKALSFYETNITHLNPLGTSRYAMPLENNFLAVSKITPNSY